MGLEVALKFSDGAGLSLGALRAIRRRLQVAIAMRSYPRSNPRKGNTRRIPLGKAVTSCLYRAKNVLEERRFDVHWARHKPEKGVTGDR